LNLRKKRKNNVDDIIPAAYYTGQQMLDRMHAEVLAERAKLRGFLMEKHEAAKSSHNYYACLAVELDEIWSKDNE
jgi:hypothetical protein